MLRSLGRIFDTILDRIFAVTGALVCMQVPQFIQQYTDVMAGALSEATRQVETIRSTASQLGKSVEEFILKHLQSSDPDFQASGRIYDAQFERFHWLREAHTALSEASTWNKPFVFFSHLDSRLLQAVDFQPGLPLSIEGLIYGIAGIIIGLFVYHMIIKIPVHIRNAFRKRRSSHENY